MNGEDRPNQQQVHDWATQHRVDGIVWTALTTNFEQKTGKRFSVKDAVEYLKGLPKEKQQLAFEYIRKAPEEVDTPLRKAVIKAEL